MLCALLAIWLLASIVGNAPATQESIAVDANSSAVAAKVARRPIGFIEDVKRASLGRTYRVGSLGSAARIDAEGFHVGLRESVQLECMTTISLCFEGASSMAELEGEDARAPVVHDLRGRLDRWRPTLPTYRRLRVRDLYPGIDLVWYERDRALEYDLEVGPGAQLGVVAIRIEGADGFELDGAGDLVIRSGAATIRERAPLAWQRDSAGASSSVECRFVTRGPGLLGLEARGFAPGAALTIDPAIVYATYVGGSNYEEPQAIAVTTQGSVAVYGRSFGGFPTTPGAYDTTYSGGGIDFADTFLAMLASSGHQLLFATYIGSSGSDGPAGLVTLADGAMEAAVWTSSTDLAVTPGAYSATPEASYVLRLDVTGSSVVCATYFAPIRPIGIGVDASGGTAIGGLAAQSGIYTSLGAYQASFQGGISDAFVARLDQALSTCIGATYVGGASTDWPGAVSVDVSGSPVITGETSSPNYPTSAGAFQATLKGPSDVFVTTLDATLSSLRFSTYLGGATTSPNERPNGIHVDASGQIYLSGISYTSDFPVTPGALDYYVYPNVFGFACKLEGSTGQPVYIARFGGTNPSVPATVSGLAVDAHGGVYLSSGGQKPFPTTPDAFPSPPGGSTDGALLELSPLGTEVAFSTMFGGTKYDGPFALAVGGDGVVHVACLTSSADWPTSAGAFDATFNGDYDVFMIGIDPPRTPYGTLAYGAGAGGCLGEERLTVEAAVHGNSPSVTFVCSHAPANATGLVLLSDAQDPAGGDPLFVGVPFYVGLWTPLLAGIDLPSGSSDLASVTVPLPSLAGLVGQTYYAQAFWYWPPSVCTPSPFGLSASNGLAITILP